MNNSGNNYGNSDDFQFPTTKIKFDFTNENPKLPKKFQEKTGIKFDEEKYYGKKIFDILNGNENKIKKNKLIEIIDIFNKIELKEEIKIILKDLKKQKEIILEDWKKKTEKNPGEESNYIENPNGTLSLEGKRIERFFAMALAIIGNYWSEFLKQYLGFDFVQPNLVIYDGHIMTETGSGKQLVNREMFINKKANTIYINSKSIGKLFNSDIGFTLALAHEIGHSITNQLDQKLPTRLSELNADFIAGATLKFLEEIELTDEFDLDKALLEFETLGILGNPETHGTGIERKITVRAGYESSPDKIIHHIKKMFEIQKSLKKGNINKVING